jgi:dTDP-4-amino-4,6-dideoxygalactose transaminase
MIPLFRVAMHPSVPKRVEETLLSGYIGEGPRVREFEEAFAEMHGYVAMLATNSCTSALDMAYHLIGLGAGDEVISTPMTCLATNMPLALRGCKIVWADVHPRTGNISPESIAKLVTPDTKAIVATDWAGRACDYNAIRAAAPGVPIVEDAAHAFGAYYMGHPLTAFGGDYIAWSFQAIKHLTTGDGGMLKVPASKYRRARLLRWYGLDREDSTAMRCLQQASEPGFKYQMNDIAATIGLANLKMAQHHVNFHRMNAAYYDRALPQAVIGLSYPPLNEHSAWIYTILVDDPAAFEQQMQEAGIQVSQVHTRNDMQECMPDADISRPRPGLAEFSAHMISIPVGWWLTSEDREYIATTVSLAVKEPVGVA